LPSKSEVVPFEVPITTIVAPGRGPSLDVTVPVLDCCAIRKLIGTRKKNANLKIEILFIIILFGFTQIYVDEVRLGN
jgi:hypothetical protein